MNPKRRKFAEEYLVDRNATAAARRAGYGAAGASVRGKKLLEDPEVRAAINAGMSAQSVRTGITADRVLREYERIAFADMRRVLTWGPGKVELRDMAALSEDDAAAVAEVSQTVTEHGGSVRIKLHDKMRALDALAKHLGVSERRAAALELPATDTAAGCSLAAQRIVDFMAAGRLTVDAGRAWLDAIELRRKAFETAEFEAFVKARAAEQEARISAALGGDDVSAGGA